MTHLEKFIAESNRIEGIIRRPKLREISAHMTFFDLPALTVADVSQLVHAICQAPLRLHPHMNVYIGEHTPPRGGPGLVAALDELLDQIHANKLTPHAAHVAYETLHPYMDGNGRSGRAIWAWHMQRAGHDPFARGFLHEFYYQTLQESDARRKEGP